MDNVNVHWQREIGSPWCPDHGDPGQENWLARNGAVFCRACLGEQRPLELDGRVYRCSAEAGAVVVLHCGHRVPEREAKGHRCCRSCGSDWPEEQTRCSFCGSTRPVGGT